MCSMYHNNKEMRFFVIIIIIIVIKIKIVAIGWVVLGWNCTQNIFR